MKNRRNYYRILRVDRGAPVEVIKASYRTLMKQLGMHPDMGGDPAEAVLVNEAYETLSDPEHRAAYDRSLRSPREGPRTAPGGASAPSSTCPFCSAASPGPGPLRPGLDCAACGSPLDLAAHHVSGEASRRAMERLPQELPVVFRRATSAGVARRGVTTDISLNGLRLLSPVELAVGERLHVENVFCTAVAVARSVTPNLRRGGFECGLEFVTLRLAHERGGLVSTVA